MSTEQLNQIITVTRCHPGSFLSDHRWIVCDLSVKKNCVQRKVVKVRNFKAIDSDTFTCLLKKTQINSSLSITNQAAKLEEDLLKFRCGCSTEKQNEILVKNIPMVHRGN